jgi:hypothetical protein
MNRETGSGSLLPTRSIVFSARKRRVGVSWVTGRVPEGRRG